MSPERNKVIDEELVRFENHWQRLNPIDGAPEDRLGIERVVKFAACIVVYPYIRAKPKILLGEKTESFLAQGDHVAVEMTNPKFFENWMILRFHGVIVETSKGPREKILILAAFDKDFREKVDVLALQKYGVRTVFAVGDLEREVSHDSEKIYVDGFFDAVYKQQVVGIAKDNGWRAIDLLRFLTTPDLLEKSELMKKGKARTSSRTK